MTKMLLLNCALDVSESSILLRLTQGSETNFAIFCYFRCFVGPVVAEAMFVNREEIPVYPIYRDPVSWLFLILIINLM